MVLNWLFLLSACTLNKGRLKSNTPITVESIAVIDDIDKRTSSSFPKSLQKRLQKELQDRNVNLVFSPQLADKLTSQRNSTQRAKITEKRPLLLIETQARFYAQLNGFFRWVVEVKIHLWNEKNESFSRTFSIPVFHQFHHERGKEAIIKSETILLRQIHAVVDDYIRGNKN